MPTCRRQLDGEPSLSEMLADPIIQTIMARDGVAGDEMAALINTVRSRLAGKRSDAPDADRLGSIVDRE
jgi:hypothetical protein